MSHVDVRGFRYDLQPLQQRKVWHCDAALRALAQALQRWQAACDLQEKLRQECEGLVAHLREAWQGHVEPGSRLRMLSYLNARRQQQQAHEAEVQAAAEALRSAREACAARQRELEGLKAHRHEALQQFIQEAQALLCAQADDDWIARQAAGRATSRVGAAA